MAGTVYSVVVDLKTVGSLDFGKGKGAGDLHKPLDNLKSSMKDIGSGISRLTSGLDTAVMGMASMAKYGAMAGTAAAIGAVTYGVVGLNKEAENAAISLGAIFSANGLASTVPAGITMAKDTVAQMRKDARDLPGEFEDLQNIFMTSAVPLFQAGASSGRAEKLSAKAMAAAFATQVPMDVAAREFAGLVSGRAGQHNILGGRLGFVGGKGHELNAAAPEKRLEMIDKALDKYGDAIAQFSTTYDAQSSSLIDNLKNFGRTATGPLFESVKSTLVDVNGWFDANQDEIRSWAEDIGFRLKDAFEWGKAKILEWYPIVANFADTAWTRLRDFWDKIQPTIEAVGKSIRSMLEDPNGTIDKLITLGEVWLALKGGGMLLDMAGGLGQLAKGMGGIFGAGGAAGAAGAAAGAAGAGELGLSTFMSAGGMLGAGGAAIGGSALGVGALAMAAIAAWTYAIEGAGDIQTAIAHEDMLDAKARTDATWREYDARIAAGESLETIMTASNALAEQFADDGDLTSWTLNDLAASARAAANSLDSIGNVGQGALEDEFRRDANANAINFLNGVGMKYGDPNASKEKKADPSKGGHGGTSIQKVEIVVTSNQHPSRIAREVVDEIGKINRNPRASRYTPNYASLGAMR